jgi:N6-L-threonylcarbamoyladenine synthase
MLRSGDLSFSFAGLKTAVMVTLRKLGPSPSAQDQADLAASTQAAIVDVLVRKSVTALQDSGLARLVVAGGVGANAMLRSRLNTEGASRHFKVHYPELALCTDNGAMIALAAAMRWQRGAAAARSDHDFNVRPRWSLATV